MTASTKPGSAKKPPVLQGGGSLIYLVDNDELFAEELLAKLEQANYQLRHFTNLGDFEAGCETETPAVVIMDIDFSDSSVPAEEVVSRLKAKVEACPPVICISACDDIEARLAAVRMGIHHYYYKPLDMDKLIRTLDGLTKCLPIKPYRVLLVDDDEISLQLYAAMLRVAGMDVETLNDPLLCLKVLAKFKPDILITDVYMDSCSGTELAQVIRQDEDYANMPIIFLSGELHPEHKLASMNLGGDDFLVKPVKADYLAAVVVARAKRAGQTGLHDVVHRMARPVGTVQDISELMEIKNRLRESEDRFAFAVEGAGDGVWEWNIRTNVLQHSRLTVEMLGYNNEEFQQSLESWINILHPDDLVLAEQKVKDYLEGRTSLYYMEQRLRCKNGRYRWVLSRGTAVERDDNGRPTRMIGIHSDITERVEAEAALHRHKDILELIAKGCSLAEVLEAVAVHAETMLSGGICSILLLDHSGKHLGNGIAPGLPDFYNEAIDGLEIGMGVGSCGEAAFSGKRVIVSDVMEHPNWTDYRELTQKAGLRACWSEPIFSSCRIVVGTFAIYYSAVREPTDAELKITAELAQFVAIVVERSQAQQALVVAKEEAENANLAKSQFLSSMSHELRTPMNAIMGFGQLLKMETDPALTESQQENADEIIRASKHLLEIINEVLDLAKIEAGRIDLSIERVEPGEVIAESIQLIMPLAQKRGIEISVIRDGTAISFEQLLLQHKAVRADRIRLKQILLNLLSNAAKYNNKNGKIIIACDHSGDKYTRISITDTGDGLSKQQQSQLFKAFSRLAPEQSDIEGTGIGLVLTRKIVELMDGSIGMDSQPGEGSTFWVELPVDTLHAAQNNVSEKKQISQSAVSISQEQAFTVLYIEDNPANLRLVTQLLGRQPNIHIWSAHAPLLGLELAAEHKPDLILLDINLPGMDGFEVLRQLQQSEVCCNTPVIAISANAMPKNIEKGLAAGFVDYITKPIDVSKFLKAVNAVLTGNNNET